MPFAYQTILQELIILVNLKIVINLKYKYHWKFKPIRAFMSNINNKLNGEISILNFKDAR